jgi:hypothetical protein
VKVMNIRDDDQVSAVALVMETSANTAAAVAEDGAEELPLEGAAAGDIGADDAADAAHGEGAAGPSPTADDSE